MYSSRRSARWITRSALVASLSAAVVGVGLALPASADANVSIIRNSPLVAEREAQEVCAALGYAAMDVASVEKFTDEKGATMYRLESRCHH